MPLQLHFNKRGRTRNPNINSLRPEIRALTAGKMGYLISSLIELGRLGRSLPFCTIALIVSGIKLIVPAIEPPTPARIPKSFNVNLKVEFLPTGQQWSYDWASINPDPVLQ